MASIGDLFFRLIADDKGFAADVDKKAAAAGDKAGQTLGHRLSTGLRKNTKDIGKGLVQGLGLGAGVAAFGALDRAVSGVVNVFGDAIDAAREEEVSIRKLDAALRANVDGYNGNTQAIEETLAARMRLGFADDEQRQSLAVLVSVTKDATKALDLQRTAMDLARLRGMSLADASQLIGKVAAGNTGILSRYGIVLRKGATATEALAEIQKRAAGQAEAYANTNEGKLLASQIKVGEAMEKLGSVLLPIAAEVFPRLADAAVFVVENLAKIGDVAATVLGPLAAMNDAVGKIPGPWKSAMDEAVAAAVEGSERLVQEVGSAALHAADQIEENRGRFSATADTFAGELPEAMEEAKEKAKKVARKTPLEIADALREKRTAWQDALETLGDDLEKEMSRGAEIAKLKAALAGDELAKGLKSKDPVVRAQAEATRNLLTGRLNELRSDLIVTGQRAGSALAEGLTDSKPVVTKAGRDLFSGAKDAIKTSTAGAYTFGYNTGAEYAKGLRATVGLVNSAATYVARGAVGPLRASSPPGPESPLHKIRDWAEATMREWAEGLRDGGASAKRAARDAVAQTVGAFGAGVAALPVRLAMSAVGPGMASVTPTAPSVASVVAPAGGNTYHVHLEDKMPPVRYPLDIARDLRMAGDQGLIK